VILVDVNLLVYAGMMDMPEHERAHSWLDAHLSGTERVGLPWESLNAFVRLTIDPRVFPRPDSVEGAWSTVRAWLQLPVVWVPSPTDSHQEILGEMIKHVSSPSGIADAHLAALAICHGLTLMSADSDFARFPNLRWENPLAT
jgi:toxin-antitoxin system PIN domain toxin